MNKKNKPYPFGSCRAEPVESANTKTTQPRERFKMGRHSEEKAKFFFQQRGYQWLVSNYKWKHGEGDLFFTDPQGDLVLVEVRSSHKKSIWLRQSINQRKVWNLARTLEHFCCRYKFHGNRRIEILFIEGEVFDHLPLPF